MFLWVCLAVVFAVLGYVRLAPSDVSRWHVAPQVTADKNFKSGVLRLVETGPDGLARFDALARKTERTSVLAGNVDAGMVTYVTRSKVFGFPDYTTVQQDGNQLKIYARLRFGRSDLGVNRARVTGWLDALQAR
jgi:uncharacterized protein (DUF1499 family)